MALQKWEYLILVVPTEKEYSLDKRKEKGLSVLERAGSDGWEAVGISESPGKWSVLLKRPLSG
ncbi:MAG TPA: hypothetical protein VM818_02520 [Vicinamibacterales bacterium]|jgi:hypothetical protein|nr:hypothetical protein [Vicinamibacterales bacterium]